VAFWSVRICVCENLTGGYAPKISAVERDAAIARIDRRHARIDDPRRSELGTDPREVLAFVLNRGPVGVPRWVAAADHTDALVLWTWCWWEDRRTERRLLRQGLAAGLSLSDLGAPLGITSRQGVRDRLDRLSGLLEYDRPDEQITRDARRQNRARDARQRWIEDHRDEVRAVLLALLIARCGLGPQVRIARCGLGPQVRGADHPKRIICITLSMTRLSSWWRGTPPAPCYARSPACGRPR
jgi:hypothetical protein